MAVSVQRRELHGAAVDVLRRFGGVVLLEDPRFSPKWLTYYQPVWLLQKIVRGTPAGRFMEAVGLLPKRYRKVAHFDADGIVLTVYQYHDLMRQAARDISHAMGVEIRLARAQSETAIEAKCA